MHCNDIYLNDDINDVILFRRFQYLRLCRLNTYSDFTQVDSIVQGVPGTLLVIWSPWLLKDLTHTLAFLAPLAIASRDAWCPRDAIAARVALSARGASRALWAAAVLENKRHRVSTVRPNPQALQTGQSFSLHPTSDSSTGHGIIRPYWGPHSAEYSAEIHFPLTDYFDLKS